jgi:protein-disulfide isomerase
MTDLSPTPLAESHAETSEESSQADAEMIAGSSEPEQVQELAPAAKPRRGLRWIYLLPVAFALGMALSYAIFVLPLRKQVSQLRSELSIAQSQVADQAAVNVPETVQRYAVPIDDDPFYGPADAPITIIEFSDYECPYCRKWHTETWPLSKENYGDLVRLVYRDFPLYGLHANAAPAAEAANCADDQDSYWAFNDALFATDQGLGRPTYVAVATELGLNVEEFNACLDDRRHQAEVEADYQYASELGVSSTPTFFINGLALVGAQPYEVFAQLIDMELNGEIPK